MSGHSKWSTIKHKKAATDSRRGQQFTKLIRAITVAARDGEDINSNFKLRLAVEKARQVNMPKDNISRAIERGSGAASGQGLFEAIYEGFGPSGSAVMVEVLTDNKNRTAAAIKKIFERSGGNLGQPGAVGFLFSKKGRLLVETGPEAEAQILKIMDLGVDDVSQLSSGIEVLTNPTQLAQVKTKVEAENFKVKELELIYVAKNYLELTQEAKAKVAEFLDQLDELDDVQDIYVNVSF